MKKLKLFLFFTSTLSTLWAQHAIAPTDAIRITGEVSKEYTISVDELMAMPQEPIKDVQITNHAGEPRSFLKGLKGVPLETVLQAVELKAESPKLYSEFALVCEASDGYKVVFSWNEIFNSPTGKKTFLITEKDGVALPQLADRIMLLCPTDIRTGRRYVKGLKSIRFVHLD